MSNQIMTSEIKKTMQHAFCHNSNILPSLKGGEIIRILTKKYYFDIIF